MFDALFQNRVEELQRTYRDSLQNSGSRQTDKQQQIIKNWAKSKEFAGMDDEERVERFEIIAALKPWAEDIMAAGDRLFDISFLADKLPTDTLIGKKLTDIQLPFETIFIGFGERPDLVVDPELGIYFEGAYVRRRTVDGQVDLDVVLVCNDPDFADNNDQVLGSVLRGMTRYYHVAISDSRPLEKAVNTVSQGCDPSVLGDRRAAVAGVTLAAKAMLYLSQSSIDADFGYQTDAPKRLVKKLQKDLWAQQELDWRGYPKTIFLGRDLGPIRSLCPLVPDLEKTKLSLTTGL